MSWPMVKIGELGTVYSGGTPSRSNSSYWGRGFKWLAISDYSDFSLVQETKEQITLEGLNNSSAKIFDEGTVIISIFATLGRVAILGNKMATNQAIAGIKCNDSVNNRFLMYSLKSKLKEITDKSEGVAQKNINLNILKNLQVQLPPLNIQEGIVDMLDRARLSSNQSRKIENELNALAQAVFLEMFGDPEHNSKNFPFKEFKDFLIELRNGISPSNDGNVEYKVLTLSAVTKNYFDRDAIKLGSFIEIPSSSKHIKENDLLICRGNGNIKLLGRAVFAGENMDDVVFPDTIIGASINQEIINNEYLSHYWKLPMVRNYIESGARTTNGTYKINQKVIESIPIMVPSIELQIKFAQKMSKIKLLMSLNHDKEAMLNSYFNGFMQRAFSGKLDLKKVA